MKQFIVKKSVLSFMVVGILSVCLFAQEASGRKEVDSSEARRVEEKTVVPFVEKTELLIMTVKGSPKVEALSDFKVTDFVEVKSSRYGNVSNRTKLEGTIQTSQLGMQTVKVTVKDMDGVCYQEEMQVSVIDTTPPQIIVSDRDIPKGEPFDLLADVTASDTFEGDLTNRLEVATDIDTQRPGTYFVEYRVSDNSNNTSVQTRLVTVHDKVKEEVTQQQAPSVELVGDEMSVSEADSQFQSLNDGMAPQRIQFLATDIFYRNGGMSQGQGIIDSENVASTWGGNSQQSGSDQANTHFIGHNPGVFTSLLSLYIGAEIRISDQFGNIRSYQVTNIFQVDDDAVGLADGVSYWDSITGVGNEEMVTFQTCLTDSVNLIVQAK